MICFISELPEWDVPDKAILTMVEAQQRILDGLSCPVHAVDPTIVIRQGDGRVIQKLIVRSCCDALDVLVRRRFARKRGAAIDAQG